MLAVAGFLAVFLLIPAQAAGALTPAQAAGAASGERITSYTVDVAIGRDGAASVRETIVYDFGADQRHGIFRQLPYLVPDGTFHSREYSITGFTAASPPGTPAPLAVSRGGGDITLRIGDPSRTVTGSHTYVISYRVRRAVAPAGSGEQFSWNLVGDSWPVPISHLQAHVRAPAAITGIACYSGFAGSRGRCTASARAGDVATFRQALLEPDQGVTAAVNLPAGAVIAAPPTVILRSERLRAFEPAPLPLGLAIALLALAWAWPAMRLRWARRRLAPRGQPDGQARSLRPGQAGLILAGHAIPGHIVATVVDLAIRGELRIQDVDGTRDWLLSRQSPPAGTPALLTYERTVLRGLFNGRDHVSISQLRSFAAVTTQASQQLTRDAACRGWLRPEPGPGPARAVTAAGVVAFVAGLVPGTPPRGPAFAGLVLLLGGLVLAVRARRARRARRETRTEEGTRLLGRVRALRKDLRSERPAGPDPWAGFSRSLPFAVAFGFAHEWTEPFGKLREPAGLSWWAPHVTGNAELIKQITAFTGVLLSYTPPRRLLRRARQAGPAGTYDPSLGYGSAYLGGGSYGTSFGGGGFGGGVGSGGGGGGGGSW